MRRSDCARLVAAAALCAGGCRTMPSSPTAWPMLGGDPSHHGHADAALTVPLAVVWSTPAGEALSASAAVAGGRLYTTSYDHHIYCLNAADGSVVWTAATGDWMESTPAIADGRVFAGSYDGTFSAWNAADGDLCWSVKTGERRAGIGGWRKAKRGVDSSACVVDGRVFFGAWDGFVYAADAATGDILWRHDAGALIHWSSPAVVDAHVYIGAADGRLLALDADNGRRLWQRQLCGPHVEHMMCGPTVDRGLVFSGAGWDGGFFALAADDGRTVWQRQVNGLVAGSPAVDADNVYVYTANRKRQGTVYAFSREDGTPRWQQKIGGSSACSPVRVGRQLVVTTGGAPSGASVFVLDAATGEVRWKFSTPDIWGSPAVVDGRLYLCLGDGHVMALAPDGGTTQDSRIPK